MNESHLFCCFQDSVFDYYIYNILYYNLTIMCFSVDLSLSHVVFLKFLRCVDSYISSNLRRFPPLFFQICYPFLSLSPLPLGLHNIHTDTLFFFFFFGCTIYGILVL